SAISEDASSNQEIIFRHGPTAVSIMWLQASLIPKLEAGSNSATGMLCVPLHVADLFYSSHGVPITEDTEWTAQGMEKYNKRFEMREGDDAHKYYIGKEEITAACNFDREPRFYAYLGFDRGKWYGNTFRYIPDEQTPFVRARFTEPANGLWPDQYNCTGYFAKKLVNVSSFFRSASEFWDTPFAYNMRYTDLLLMYAEALNETAAGEDARPDPLVYQLIDGIRDRAGLEGIEVSWRKYTNNPDYPSTKAGMREIIRMERKIELVFEQMDYWDSRRWKTAPAEQNRSVQGWNTKEEEAERYYRITDLYTQKFTFRDYLSPVPEDDIIKNPKLIQNPQW
ncbi:MAG: RagB/SusD family nutrient uptake outer membrane protein, partial [Dysgonamonadaceae bacterium]|nr:RagB/SusD family nutrient uptake outer membrane protein [Dysgonamonadaceae bacterium]